MKYFYKVTMVVSASIAVLFAYWAGINTGLSDTGNWGILAQMLPDGEFGDCNNTDWGDGFPPYFSRRILWKQRKTIFTKHCTN